MRLVKTEFAKSKWAGLALVAGLAATIVEIAQKKNRYDYVGHCIFDQLDAASQQNYAASARNRQKSRNASGFVRQAKVKKASIYCTTLMKSGATIFRPTACLPPC